MGSGLHSSPQCWSVNHTLIGFVMFASAAHHKIRISGGPLPFMVVLSEQYWSIQFWLPVGPLLPSVKRNIWRPPDHCHF